MKNILIGLALAIATPIAGAQSAGMPTDNDLKAAYCLGSDRVMVADLQDTLSGAQGDERFATVVDSLRSNIATLQNDARRLEAYVLPKAAADDNYLFALSSAINRGKADAQGLASDPQMNACLASCQAQLAPITPAKVGALTACGQQCAPPYVARIRACRDLSWLPF